MKRLTIEDAQPLNDRLRSLSADTIIGFPATNDDGTLKLNALKTMDSTAHAFLTDSAKQNVDPDLQQRFPSRGHSWLAGIKERVTTDWHDLRSDSYPPGTSREFGQPILAAFQKEQFVADFNTLMNTAEGEGWLLGFGWGANMGSSGDFGGEPPLPEFSRILLPKEPGTVGFRDLIIGVGSLDYDSGVLDALRSSVVNLGLQG